MPDVAPQPLLSRSELLVLRCLAVEGLSEREAAERLSYSYRHIRRLAAHAARQLGARSTRQAIYYAARRGLI